MPPAPPPSLPPDWQIVEDPGGTYYWNTVTQAVSWTQPDWPTSGPPPPAAKPPHKSQRPPGAVGADARNQAMNDPAYMSIVNKNATNMRTLQKGLSNLDVAVRMPPTTAVPPAPYANPKGFANLPPPSGYSAPPPGGGAPPLPSRGPPPNGGAPPIPSRGGPPPSGGGPPKGGPPPGGGGAPPKGGAPPSGGGGGGRGGGDKAKPPEPTAMQHRLRAIPYYARNVGLLTSTVEVWLGIIMLVTPEYLDGVETDFLPETFNQPSPYGGAMCACCLLGGAFMFAFESYTFMRQTVYVMPWLWKLRTGLYACLALPGFFTAYDSQLMPPLIGSIFCLFSALLNAVSTLAELPNAKQWGWVWYTSSAANKKKAELVRSVSEITPLGLVAGIPQRFIELFEQGKLVRTVFLLWYSTLNLVLYVEAYYRHKGSPVGLALRGEAFFVCTGADGLIRPCIEGPTSSPAGPLPILQEVGAGNAYPYAKGFGQLLNLNCALMLLPVFRKGVRYLHDISALKGSRFNFIQYILPLDKNIVGHKMIAKYWIFFSVWGHATAHYFNYAKAPYYESEFAKLISSTGATSGASHIYVGKSLYMAWNTGAP